MLRDLPRPGFLHQLGEIVFRELLTRIKHKSKEEVWIHDRHQHLSICFTWHVPILIQSILVLAKAKDCRHFSGRKPIVLAYALDLFWERDAIFCAILVIHLGQVCLVQFRCGKTLMGFLALVKLMDITELLLAERQS